MLHFLTLYVLPLFPFLGLLWSPCCCTSCQFFSDDFSSNDISNYTQVSGSWSIGSGVLSIANSNAVLTGNTANPNSDSNTKVSATVNIATNGDTARIILDYQNSSNYWFAEVSAGSSPYLRIYQRSGGSNTKMAECASFTQAAASNFTFCASIESSNSIKAYVNGTGIYSVSTSGSFSQIGYGLGTGTRTGTITFDNLTVTTSSGTGSCVPCTGGGSCGTCGSCTSPGIAPVFISVTVAGVTDNSCGDCDTGFNVSFLDIPLAVLSAGTVCDYSVTGAAVTACSTDLDLEIDIEGASSVIGAQFSWHDTFGLIIFGYSFSPDNHIDCTTLVGKVLTFSAQSGPTTRCTFTGSTITITDAVFA